MTATASTAFAPSLVGSTDSIGDREEPTAACRTPVGGADRIANAAADRFPRGQGAIVTLDRILREAGILSAGDRASSGRQLGMTFQIIEPVTRSVTWMR